MKASIQAWSSVSATKYNEIVQILRVTTRKIKGMITPFHLLVSGYMFVTFAGALLLSLPVATVHGGGQSFVDALFVATSGISTSGLSIVDIGSYYTLFGQIVLLCIFQIGGIGYMAVIIFLSYILGMRTSMFTQIVAKESIAGPSYKLLGRFFLATIYFTLVFEAAGAIALSIFWLGELSPAKAVYFGIFHSISTFCTAGFGLYSDSLMKYNASYTVNITVNVISLAGGVGFFVLYEIYLNAWRAIKRKSLRKLSLHSRLVILLTALVVIGGTIVIFTFEAWEPSTSTAWRLSASLFQAVSASTTDGFNSIDISRMSTPGLTAIMALMFIGASPGSTGGGIKTTTMGTIVLYLLHQLKGRDEVSLMNREIPSSSVLKAFGIFTWFIIIIFIDLIILCGTGNATFIQTLFEIVSALGNTGLSMGITPGLSFIGKVALTVTMFIGRVGPLTFGFFLAGKEKPLPFRHPEEDIFIG